MVSPWDAIGGTFEALITLFQEEQLSTTLPYRVFEASYGLPEAGEMFQAELKRQLERHKGPKACPDEGRGKGLDASAWAERLNQWARKIQEKRSPTEEATSAEITHTTTENLAQWLILARFIAQRGGGE
jgi:response regulator of citrate/malate metabolism